MKVTTQLPALRVLSFEPDFVQILFDDLATLKETVAFDETIVTPTRFAKDLATYFFFALTVLADNSAAAPLTVSSVYSFTPKPPRQHENHIYFTPQPSQTRDNNMLEQKKAGSLRGSFSTASHSDTHAMASTKHAT